MWQRLNNAYEQESPEYQRVGGQNVAIGNRYCGLSAYPRWIEPGASARQIRGGNVGSTRLVAVLKSS